MKGKHLLILLFWKFLLDISYIYFVVPLFEYYGFNLEWSHYKIIESYLLTIILGYLTPRDVEKPGRFLIYVLFLSVIVPIISYYSLSNVSAWPLYLISLQYLILLFVYKFWKGNYFKIKPLEHGVKIATSISLAFVVLMLIYTLVIQGGINRLNFDLSKIYEVRETSNDVFGSGIFGYFLPWTFRVFNILLIVLAIQRRNILGVLLFVGIQIIFFGLTGFKAVLIYPLVLLGVYYVLKSKYKLDFLFLGLILSIILPLVVFWFSQNMTLSSMFIRRTYFVPSMITFQYYDFFSKNEFVLLSNSIFSSIFNYPYEERPAILISTHNGFGDEANSNTGFLATSYMHFGLFGVIIYPLIIGMIIKLIDKFEDFGTPKWIILGLLILPFNGLFRSADLTTSLLTHGLGVAIFMLWLINRK